MFTTLKAELLLHEVNARIDHYSAMVSSLEDLAGTIESACDRFNFDCDVESDYHVASRISFYTQHIMKSAQDFQGMSEWYKHRLEIEERKRAKLREFLKANADDYFDAADDAEKPATDTIKDDTFCFECGRWIEDTNDMDACMFAQPSHECGTVTKKIHAGNDRYYAEFVCTDCLEKHYHQCAKCAEFYHESRCIQDEHGNWLCENCREDKSK